MRRILPIIGCLLAFFLAMLTASASAAPKVFIDSKQLAFDVPPLIEQGRTLIPLRGVFEAFGAQVRWDGATRTVTATKGQTTVKLTVGARTAYVNGSAVTLDVPAKIVNGRTLVPLRFVSESLGCRVAWDAKTQTVTIASAPKTETPHPGKELAGKKVLLVIAPKDFRDEEFFTPKQIFAEKGTQVTVASTARGTATGMLGGKAKVDLVFAEVRASSYDAVVIAGGTGSETYLWGNQQLRRIVQEAYAQGKVVAAICLSPVVLARAGCLKGREATVFPDPAAVKELKSAGAKYVNRSVVTAGKVVTGRDPEAAGEFAQVVARLLSGR
ncbi:DJ-1/PfpI/YhbO family deglycase/protease [Thermodesulfitimonas autotrophica]|uniref:DJ-1/PfpI/YhbO family deglycase/protease n=1 Tax=Thermodesulfitimonas autotrophica TaxID=1894989 RepID=UPI002FE03EE4